MAAIVSRTSLVLGCLLVAGPVWAQQSTNHQLHAVPPPGTVQIDGRLDDWDLSGQIEVFANARLKTSYSTRVAAMYDDENFYLAVIWRDPTPMHNMIDADFDLGFGWRSDCLQLRMITDMVVGAIDCWYSTAADRPVVNIAYGRFSKGQNAEDTKHFKPLPDATQAGALEAFAKGADGKSYTQEIALPWRLITGQGAIVKETGEPYKPPKRYAAGDTFTMGMEFLWGGTDGKTWPVHRYADLLAAGQTSREFFWTAEKAWGSVILEPKGNLQLPATEFAVDDAMLQKTEGPVPLSYTMPFDGYVTLVIEDADGRRMRNLLGMAPRRQGEVIDFWDGLDDAGNLVPVGSYRWRGLFHQGIDPVYEASYGTPGSPPWDTADNTGSWMSDHAPPLFVTAAKNMMVLGASGAEAGWGVIGTDLDGRKKWGDKKFWGMAAAATDSTHLYIAVNPGHGREDKPPVIARYDLSTGSYAPFATTAGDQLEIPVAAVGEHATQTGIAVVNGRLAVSLAGADAIRSFDSKTGTLLGETAVSDPKAIAAAADGSLWVISGTQVMRLAADKLTPVITSQLDQPHAIAVDTAGRVYVSDRGSQQVKVFAADGSFQRAIGGEGGRPKPGLWTPGGMRNPAGIAVDTKGRLWVAEEDMYPKRVSVWSTEGEFLEEFVGPTTYGGMGGFADSQDKTRVFGSGCEWQLDYVANRADIRSNCLTNVAEGGDLLRADGREYFMGKRNRLSVRDGGGFRPVARFDVVSVKQLAESGLPLTPPEGTKDRFSYVWTDRNGDGEEQADEFMTTLIPLATGYWGGYWLDENFNLISDGSSYGHDFAAVIPRVGWTPAGAPVWDLARPQIYLDRPNPNAGGSANQLLLANRDEVILGHNPIMAVRPDGTIPWTYPLDGWGVHGSHHAAIPKSDAVIVGMLSPIGVAELDEPFERVFALNSNMGRLYLMTTDGLLVASVFQDCRMAPDAWPADPKPGSPLGGVSMGGEWFGGFFFKSQPTGEYYLIAGPTSYNLIRLNGFDTLTPLTGGTVTFGADQLLAAEALQQRRATAETRQNTLSIRQLTAAPSIDGKLEEYAKESFVAWAAGSRKVKAAVAADGKNLYLAYDVAGDSNPMVNAGKDFTQLFTTGDSVDLQLGTNPAAAPGRTTAAPGDLRLLISVLDDTPVAVLYRWKADGETRPQTFTSPWRTHAVDDVRRVDDADISIQRHGSGYRVEAAVPLAALGFSPLPGQAYKLDLGVIYSDANGTNRAARVYWANKATGLINDVPGEIMAQPGLWGEAVWHD